MRLYSGHRVEGGGGGVKINELNEAGRVSHEIKSMRRFHQFKQTKSHSDVLRRSMLFRHAFFYLFVNDTAKEDKIKKKRRRKTGPSIVLHIANVAA